MTENMTVCAAMFSRVRDREGMIFVTVARKLTDVLRLPFLPHAFEIEGLLLVM